MENKHVFIKLRTVLFVLILIFCSWTAFSQTDTRYDAGLNLPFNEKAGDVNPQTGNLTLGFTDVSLPGRAGYGFSFGRVWSLNRSNVYTMYQDPNDGSNRLGSQTIEMYNHMGVGWSSNLPYVYADNSGQDTVLNLILGGNVYEIDRTGMTIDNQANSNILWYDLKDMRFYHRDTGLSIGYDEYGDLSDLQANYGVTDQSADRSEYVLIFKSNEKYWFRADGRLLMREDRSGLNRIWYFYDAESKLKVVVDTVGREIGFSYDTNNNLESISWDVEVGVKLSDGSRDYITETRSIQYTYESVETSGNFPLSAGLKSSVVDYREPFTLITRTDHEGNITRYEYEEGLAGFSYDQYLSHWQNAYIMLKSITSMWTADENFKSKRCLEYEVPAKGMYTKYFYTGYMEYYKISREYLLDRQERVMLDTSYTYHDNGEANNYNQYTAVIKQGGVSTTYVYSLSGEANKDHVLDKLLTESEDGFKQERDFVYNAERTKTLEEVFRGGVFAYREKYQYDSKGNLKRFEDRGGLVTVREYDPKYSIPVKEVKLVTVEGAEKSYEAENIINALGQVIRQKLYLEQANGSKRAVTVAEIAYDAYGNPVSQTDAEGVKVHTEYDEAYHTFPVKIWQAVGIDSWSGGGTVHDNWLTEPDGEAKVIIRSFKVWNTDGSVWIEVDNEGYAVEHYYDKNGIEVESISPDLNDITDFAQPVPALWDGGAEEWIPDPGAGDFTDFWAEYLEADMQGGNAYLQAREDNPGARMEVYYQEAFILTEADIDVANGDIKRTGAQADGLGNTEEEIEFGPGSEVHGLTGLSIHAVKSMTYDTLGRMVGLTDPDASQEYVTVNVDGTSVAKHDKTWVVWYDDLGRTQRVLYPVTEPGRTDRKVVSYNDAENSVLTIDPSGRKVYERYDWSGNLKELVAMGDADTPATDVQSYFYQYDELNRKIKFTDAKGIVTTYAYDERNLLLKQDYGTTGKDIMSYNDLGQLVKKSDREGHVLSFTYDELGRNTEVLHYETEADFNADNTSRTVETVYDNRGNAVRIDNDHLIEHYIYDYANRVITLERRLKDATLRQNIANVWGGDEASQVFEFTYTYNDAGMVTEMTYPDGSVHEFSYDAELARLEQIAEGEEAGSVAPFVTGLSYNKSGVVTRMDYANATWQTWEFDNRKRIKGIDIMGPGGSIEELDYNLNASGDILSINDNEYSYDGFDRIIGAKTKLPENTDTLKLVEEYFGTYDGGDPIDGVSYNPIADLNSDGRVNGADHITASLTDEGDAYDIESFSYDKNGNRTKLTQNGDEYIYQYGERNRLEKIYVKKQGEFTQILFAEYNYDKNGNTIKRTIYHEQTNDVISFEYDTMNRLLRTVEGAEWTEYLYDNAGNRFVKKRSDGSLSFYLRHGQIAVAMDVEIAETGNTEYKAKINRYVLSGDLLAGRVTKTIALDDSVTVTRSWYHLDHLNSTKCVTDASGVIEVNYIYRAFGEQLRRLDAAGLGTDDKAKYSYGGKELDDNSNLYYFNARYYDATIGRFINVDPIQDGSNWYVYAGNNPLIIIDPTGLEEVIVNKPEDPVMETNVPYKIEVEDRSGESIIGYYNENYNNDEFFSMPDHCELDFENGVYIAVEGKVNISIYNPHFKDNDSASFTLTTGVYNFDILYRAKIIAELTNEFKELSNQSLVWSKAGILFGGVSYFTGMDTTFPGIGTGIQSVLAGEEASKIFTYIERWSKSIDNSWIIYKNEIREKYKIFLDTDGEDIQSDFDPLEFYRNNTK